MTKNKLSLRLQVLFAGFVLFASSYSQAAEWQHTNLQVLHGNEYKRGNGDSYEKTMLTVEHASGWAYGSNFFFFDISSPDTDDNTTFYGEISPAISGAKTGLFAPPDSFIKDILWQFNFELPQGPAKRANLTGLTIEWKDIGMDYFATQFLYRDAQGVSGSTGQLTLVWKKTFGPESFPMEFSGFLDWAGKESTIMDQLQMQPGLYWDVSRQTSQEVPVKVGVEYLYWKNKYGIDGLTESLPQAKLTWIF